MAKPKIKFETGHTYHVWTHANGNENLFRSDENYRYFMKKYFLHVYPVVKTYAYCLMPNHLHLMVKVREEQEILEFLRNKRKDPNLQGFENLGGLSNCISQQISNLFNAYTKAYNCKYNRKGSLFTPNFGRKQIDSEQYFARLIVYIHNNPVYHGFVENPGEWRYSSWKAYLLAKSTNVEIQEGLEWFGSINTFKALHHELKQEKLKLALIFEG